MPHGHCKNPSTVAAITADGIVASATYDGGTNAARFVGFVRDHLVPALRSGQVVVLDNLFAHHKAARAQVEAAGCRLLHLPAYSPDLNPIENAIAKVKSVLRKQARRTMPELLNEIPRALAAVTADDGLGFIGRAGYATK